MATTNAIRERYEIPEKDKWAVEDLFPSDEAWAQELATIPADREKLASFAGKLGESAQQLYTYLDLMEKVTVKGSLLANYAMRQSDVDTRVAKYQAMVGQFMTEQVALNAATSFETPEILAITDEQLEAFYAAEPKLERYRRYLWDIRRRMEHALSPAEEKLLAAAGEMANGPSKI